MSLGHLAVVFQTTLVKKSERIIIDADQSRICIIDSRPNCINIDNMEDVFYYADMTNGLRAKTPSIKGFSTSPCMLKKRILRDKNKAGHRGT